MNLTRKSSFDYYLPKHLIAQYPLSARDKCRLLQVDLENEAIRHRQFPDIFSILKPSDLLVINTSKVIPARLYGYKTTGARAEVLLLREILPDHFIAKRSLATSRGGQSLATSRGVKTSAVHPGTQDFIYGNRWECLVKPGQRLREDAVIYFSHRSGASPLLTGKIVKCRREGIREIEFYWNCRYTDTKGKSFLQVVEKLGRIPLPPYIKRNSNNRKDNETSLQDKEYYQTVYADTPGSAAAPTAGLHFTGEMLQRLKQKGVRIVPVVLHIGIDTFRPVKTENILEHKMHREFCTIPAETAQLINQAKKKRQRIISVGTTVTRTLESFAEQNPPRLTHGSKWSDLFIYPGFKFKITDGLLTNFHLPESSLLMLVTAFGGYDRIMKAYKEAVAAEYRFFSYGDAMLIL